jgi:hypothetical protein
MDSEIILPLKGEVKLSNIYTSLSGAQRTHCILFISVINQFNVQNICFTISLFHASKCFEHHVLIIRMSKFHYTASGIIKPIGGRLVHKTATYRFDDTRGCVMKF